MEIQVGSLEIHVGSKTNISSFDILETQVGSKVAISSYDTLEIQVGSLAIQVGSVETWIGSKANISSLTALTTQVGSKTDISSFDVLETQMGSYHGYDVGSIAPRVINVATPPAAPLTAGTAFFDTTRKVVLFSDGTSCFLGTGSLA